MYNKKDAGTSKFMDRFGTLTQEPEPDIPYGRPILSGNGRYYRHLDGSFIVVGDDWDLPARDLEFYVRDCYYGVLNNLRIDSSTIPYQSWLTPVNPGCYFTFGMGRFDRYAVYKHVLYPTGFRTVAYQDAHYFTMLVLLGRRFRDDVVMEDVRAIYEHMSGTRVPGQVFVVSQSFFGGEGQGMNVRQDILRFDSEFATYGLRELARKYGSDAEFAYMAFLHIYYGFLAEENKAGTCVGCSIKFYACYRLLVEHADIYSVTQENRNVSANIIRKKCESCGIHRFVRDRDVMCFADLKCRDGIWRMTDENCDTEDVYSAGCGARCGC